MCFLPSSDWSNMHDNKQTYLNYRTQRGSDLLIVKVLIILRDFFLKHRVLLCLCLAVHVHVSVSCKYID